MRTIEIFSLLSGDYGPRQGLTSGPPGLLAEILPYLIMATGHGTSQGLRVVGYDVFNTCQTLAVVRVLLCSKNHSSWLEVFTSLSVISRSAHGTHLLIAR